MSEKIIKRRDTYLINMANILTHLNYIGRIYVDDETEEYLIEFIVDTVDEYIEKNIDKPFDNYATRVLIERFNEEE